MKLKDKKFSDIHTCLHDGPKQIGVKTFSTVARDKPVKFQNEIQLESGFANTNTFRNLADTEEVAPHYLPEINMQQGKLGLVGDRTKK